MLPQRTGLFMALTILFVLARISHGETIAVDDFNDGNDDGWSHSDDRSVGHSWGPGIYDASSGAYRVGTTGVVSGGLPTGLVGATWDASVDPLFSDGVWRTTVRAETSGTEAGVVVRFDPNAKTGYAFGLNWDGLGGFFFLKTDGTPPPQSEAFYLPGQRVGVGEDWIIEVGAIGDQFTFKAWPDGGPEPASPLRTFTDSTFSTGLFGISTNGLSGSQSRASFDDILFTPYELRAITLRAGDTYLEDFDTALGINGQITDQQLPNGWAGTHNGFGLKEVVTKSFPAGTSLGSGTLLYNAGGDQNSDRALAIGIGRNTTEGILQLSANVTESDASAFQLTFDVEAWDAARVTSLGEAAFDVTLDLNSGDGFAPLVDLGRVTTGPGLFPSAGDYVDGNSQANRVSFDSGRVEAQIPADSQLRVRWTAASDAAIENWVFGLDNVSLRLFGTQLLAGDADQDLDFDQLDLVQVQVANKYLTGQAATWGEGDWDGAPGGSPGNPPAGDGQFNQFDIIAAQQGAAYLTGPYASIVAGGQRGDGQTSVIYDPSTGELAVDAPSGVELTSINIDSAGGIFTGNAAENLGGSFDNDADRNIFKATFGSSFGSLSFGHVAQTGLSEEFVLGDLTVIGSLAGGGDLGAVDLVYVPEPASALLLAVGIVTGLLQLRRFRLRS